MQNLATLMGGLGPWNWFILAVILFSLETLIPGVLLLWFGIAAAIVGLLGLATGFVWQWQVIAFALIAMITVFWVRRYVRPEATKSDLPDLNVRGAQYIGRIVVVETAIHSGRGKVKVGDTVWTAVGEDAPVGSEVEVTGVQDTALVVQQVDRE